MPRAESAQFNIRSHFARERVEYIARETGMTKTQVVEEALRAYIPPPPDSEPPPGLIRKGWALVKPMFPGERHITSEETQAMIDEVREARGDPEAERALW